MNTAAARSVNSQRTLEFSNLPPELQLHIFSHFDQSTRISAILVNKEWLKLAESSSRPTQLRFNSCEHFQKFVDRVQSFYKHYTAEPLSGSLFHQSRASGVSTFCATFSKHHYGDPWDFQQFHLPPKIDNWDEDQDLLAFSRTKKPMHAKTLHITADSSHGVWDPLEILYREMTADDLVIELKEKSSPAGYCWGYTGFPRAAFDSCRSISYVVPWKWVEFKQPYMLGSTLACPLHRSSTRRLQLRGNPPPTKDSTVQFLKHFLTSVLNPHVEVYTLDPRAVSTNAEERDLANRDLEELRDATLGEAQRLIDGLDTSVRSSMIAPTVAFYNRLEGSSTFSLAWQ